MSIRPTEGPLTPGERLRSAAAREGIYISPEQARRAAEASRRRLADTVSDDDDHDDAVDNLGHRIEEEDRNESFLGSALLFPIRHPVMTVLLGLGGVAATGYFTGRLSGWIERLMQRVGVRAVNASTRTIAPLGGTEGINPGGGVDRGLNTPL